MKLQASRRRFLQGTAAAAAFSPLPAATMGDSNIYTRLGVRPVINGVGTVTNLGGSIMPPEVVRAMEEASKFFVPLPELQLKAGARLAEILGVPAAMVTAGAASAITVATAACAVSGDASKLHQLPDTAQIKSEVIQQKTHRSGYEAQMRLVGVKVVQVETRAELDAAINERTAMLHFLNVADPAGQIKREEWISVGKQRNVPTFRRGRRRPAGVESERLCQAGVRSGSHLRRQRIIRSAMFRNAAGPSEPDRSRTAIAEPS